MIYKRRS